MANGKITVLNRTGNAVWVGLDFYDPGNSPAVSHGYKGAAIVGPGASHDFVTSGTVAYKVGFVTTASGYFAPPSSGTRAVQVYNAFPGALVTLATEMGTTGTPSPSKKE